MVISQPNYGTESIILLTANLFLIFRLIKFWNHGLTAVPSRRRMGNQVPGFSGNGCLAAASSLISMPQPGLSLRCM